jgi:peptidoglycan/LPS O-acetylase OafA/YrhL
MNASGSRHVRALDGIRGLAVAAVLAFHSGYGWASGGFLGVSVFFTLSGFLITSRLLRERATTGSVDLRAFYRRRVARLLPAGLLGLVLALAVGRATAGGAPELRGDLLAALAQVANWRWLLSSQSYEDLFAAPSPVLHYWSLAIEEQFYLVFPPLLVWALRSSVDRLRSLLVVGVVASWLLLVALVVADLRDAAYYATPARLGEILVGGLLATVADTTTLRTRVAGLRWASAPALVALGAAVVAASSTGRWDYAIWLPATAVLSVLLIVGADRGPLARALGWAPLVAVGRISYGVYVFHWPVFLWLTPVRTGLGPTALFVARAAVTLGLAIVSYGLVERPMQRWARTAPPRRRRVKAVALVSSPAVLIAVLAGTSGLRPATELTAARTPLEDDELVDTPSGVPRVALFGDSTALVTGLALSKWGDPVDRVGVAGYEVPLGCGLELPGERRWRGKVFPISEKCSESAARWPDTMADSGARMAVIQSGPWEVTDHRSPGEETWRHLGDPVLDEAYRDRFLAAVDTLVEAGAERVVWLTSPTFDVGRSDVNHLELPESDPARVHRYNELVREVARQRPAVVVLDLGARVDAWSEAEDVNRRVDGVHLTEAAALDLVEAWLGPALLEIWASLGPDR